MLQAKNYTMETKFPKLSIFLASMVLISTRVPLKLSTEHTTPTGGSVGWAKVSQAPTANFQELNPKINLFLDTKQIFSEFRRFVSEIGRVFGG